MGARGTLTPASAIPGLDQLWAETRGDPRICVAILDGPVDRKHTSLTAANLVALETLVSGQAASSASARHGTHVASVIFGQPGGSVAGIAPGCRGLVVPIFSDGPTGSIRPSSQIDLARTILQAAQHGAHVINVSGGEFSPGGAAHPILADAVRYCAENDILIVAAAGNEGCACLHVPGAMPSVLAVGAMDARGRPLEFSNWGGPYQSQGVLALGENILGASPSGGTTTFTGTSFATPIVSGIAALLLSLQLKRGQRPNARAVRAAILQSALGCNHQPVPDCQRLLAGRLNVGGAVSLIIKGGDNVSEPLANLETVQTQSAQQLVAETAPDTSPIPGVRAASCDVQGQESAAAATQALSGTVPQPSVGPTDMPTAPARTSTLVTPSACGCGCGGAAATQLVYALGQLGYDFGTEARRDAVRADAEDYFKAPRGKPPSKPHVASNLVWTLNFDATPIYAIRPQGPYAKETFAELREFYKEQEEAGIERVAVPGYLAGRTTLLNGQVVPVIQPELLGMANWNTERLVEAVRGHLAERKRAEAKATKGDDDEEAQEISRVLDRIYHEFRNLGMTPQDRAINYAATNALMVSGAILAEARRGYKLDTIHVERSPICRPGSDCWDVKFVFFNPRKRLEEARGVYRICVDVSDVLPVVVGKERCWHVN